MKPPVLELPHLSKTYLLSTALSSLFVLAGAYLFASLGLKGMYGIVTALGLMLIFHFVGYLKMRRMCRTLFADANSNTSYRYFYRMTANFYIAYDSFIYCAFSSLAVSYGFNTWKSLLSVAIYAIFTFTAIFLLYFLVVKKINAKYDDPSTFAAGVLIWIATALLTYFGVIKAQWLSFALFCLSFSIMISILNNLHANMKVMLSYIADRNPEVMAAFDDRSIAVGQMVATAIMIPLTVFAGKNMVSTTIFYDSMLLAPLVFLVAAYFAAVKEPMDDILARRLNILAERKDKDQDVEEFKRAMKRYLTNERKRVGVRLIASLVSPWFRCKAENVDIVDETKGPVIFVSNHLQIYGPIVCVLHLPFFFRPWIINKMLDPDKVEAQLKPGINHLFKWAPKRVRDFLPKIAKNLVIYVMRAMHPIPVYRGGAREVVETFKNTVEALKEEDNILLFPEKGHYADIGVSDLYTGFAQIGNLYYRETGRCVSFYPIYISRKNKRMRIGQSVTFDPSHPKAEEKQRIAESIFNTMHEMTLQLENGEN